MGKSVPIFGSLKESGTIHVFRTFLDTGLHAMDTELSEKTVLSGRLYFDVDPGHAPVLVEHAIVLSENSTMRRLQARQLCCGCSRHSESSYARPMLLPQEAIVLYRTLRWLPKSEAVSAHPKVPEGLSSTFLGSGTPSIILTVAKVHYFVLLRRLSVTRWRSCLLGPQCVIECTRTVS